MKKFSIFNSAMNATRLKEIEEIYHSAAERTPADREEFVKAECGGDETLRREVISLLSYDEISDSFIDSSPDAIAAEMFSEEEEPTLIGKTIGHYDIKKLVGVGGMGEVYLAYDKLLNRKVALKLVPPDLAQHRGHLNRFKQEAKAASALNHPNILTIHEFGNEDGSNYIVSEFVDGVTLRQRIMRSVLSGSETLEIASQVASALSAAHELGIIHRDIKPENIMIRRDGIVKVLDFGLAKLTMPIASNPEKGGEDQTLLKTTPGSVMGTASYMSPEQARGVKVDGRTDIWSLGVLIYEMVTGRRPFEGATQTDVLVAILNAPAPSLDDLVTNAPPELDRIISKALAKDVENRYQTIGEMASDIRGLKARLEFEAELQRTQGDRSATRGLRRAATEAQTEMMPAVSTAPDSAEGLDSRSADKGKRRLFILASLAALVIVTVISTAMWRSARSDTSSQTSAGDQPIALSPAASAPSRILTYSLTVQSFTDGRYEDPFRLSGEMLFRNKDRIRLNIKSPQSGNLYILNQGPQDANDEPSYNILFPSPTSNDGSAFLPAGREIQIPQQSWFELDNKEGTESVWLVWSANAIPELESAKRFANAEDKGRINEANLNRTIELLLQKNQLDKSNIGRDDNKKESIVTASADIVAHNIKLEHH
ncbi:MAG TPA: protein kinase [Pyrinomonadaceae bacterium]|nr:protein kinase [Pyrinomonadaceae bacterium]